jgi:hypothetical protein
MCREFNDNVVVTSTPAENGFFGPYAVLTLDFIKTKISNLDIPPFNLGGGGGGG